MAMVMVVVVFVDRFTLEGTLAMRVIAATSDVPPRAQIARLAGWLWLALA